MTAATAAQLSDRPGLRAIRLVIDDHEIVRAGLGAILASEPDFDVVGEAGPDDDPRLPWTGKPRAADILCWLGNSPVRVLNSSR